MDNQHRQIKGYRDLTEHEISLINAIKGIGESLGKLCEDASFLLPDVDQRWIEIGKTNLQQGIMALVRAIARPTTF